MPQAIDAAMDILRNQQASEAQPREDLHALGPGVPRAGELHTGPITAPVAGRTDHLPMKVRSNSYVLPADVVSAMGEGNTDAGYKIVEATFPPFNGEVEGLVPEDQDSGIDIEAAGGEVVLSPEQVAGAGNGSLKNGHEALDQFVLAIRKQHISTLKKLPGPVRD